MNRTHVNGELRISDVGKKVSLIGWVAKRRNLGSLVFIDLRDRTGITQILVDETLTDSVKSVRNEYILNVEGTVIERTSKNTNLPTGEIEVKAEKIEIINTAAQTPFIIADETDALEDTRLKYRKEGYIGRNRLDIAVAIIGDIVNRSYKFGIGKLSPSKYDPVKSYYFSNDFFGKILTYTCTDFMKDYTES